MSFSMRCRFFQPKHAATAIAVASARRPDDETAAPEKASKRPDKNKPQAENVKAKSTAAAPAASVLSVASMGAPVSRARVNANQRAAARAAAGNGEKNRFAVKIVEVLRRSIPVIKYKKGRKRTLIVKFSLDGAGGVRYVKIEKSSGRRRLDRTLVTALQEITFPHPPKTMTSDDLTYRLPFYFN